MKYCIALTHKGDVIKEVLATDDIDVALAAANMATKALRTADKRSSKPRFYPPPLVKPVVEEPVRVGGLVKAVLKRPGQASVPAAASAPQSPDAHTQALARS